MTSTVNQTFINRYSADVHMLVQQQMSKLRSTVKTENARGEKHFFNRLNLFNTSNRTGVGAPIVHSDAEHSRRMVTLQFPQAAYLVDDFNSLQSNYTPTSDYVIQTAKAFARNTDDIIIDALLGTAATGKDGTGSASFDSNNQVAHGSTGLTTAKISSGLKLLEAAEVDLDMTRIFMTVPANGVEDLLGDSTNHLTSFDFQDSKALAGSSLPNYRGVTLIRTQRVPDETADTTYRSIMYTEDAVRMAIAQDLSIRVSERGDLEGIPDQVYATMSLGAVRMEEALVVDILFQGA